MTKQRTVEDSVAQHYGRDDLERAILDALAASGKDIARLTPDDLSPVDEFHTGGRQATIDLAEQMDIARDMHLLDVGCGIGGASRFVAQHYGCRVTGIDLTNAYVRTAEVLAQRLGLAGRVTYRQASALALPFAPATFDGAYMLHVGMNIEDKPSLFAEIRRVLRPGAVLGVYDVMRTGDGTLRFPLHWATTAATSFVVDAAAYRGALDKAGFDIVKERDRSAFAREAFRQAVARAAGPGGPPPLGIHILMKTDVAQKLANVVDAIETGTIAPVEIVCRAR